MTQTPNPSQYTNAPVRNRLRLELDATLVDVWAIVGDHKRLPEYSAGIEAVDVGGGVRTCQFRGGPSLRERVLWESANLGYAVTAEPGNAFGLDHSFSLVTVQPAGKGTALTWEERYDSADLAAARASYDEGLADIAAQLVKRFGGRIVERYVDSASSVSMTDVSSR